MEMYGANKGRRDKDEDDSQEEGDCYYYPDPLSASPPAAWTADDGDEQEFKLFSKVEVNLTTGAGAGGAGNSTNARKRPRLLESASILITPAEKTTSCPGELVESESPPGINHERIRPSQSEGKWSLVTRSRKGIRYRRWVKEEEPVARIIDKNSSSPSSFLGCGHCSERCLGPDELRRHMVESHPIEFCPVELPSDLDTSPQGIEAGIRLLVDQCGRPGWGFKLKCAFCWKQFLSEFQQREHLLEAHFTHMFASRYEAMYLKHEKEEAERQRVLSQSLASSCVQCKRVFRSKTDLRRHGIVAHPWDFFYMDLPPGTRKKEFEGACRSVWRKSGAHENTRAAAYKCFACLERFKGPQGLRIHIMEKHLDVVISSLDMKVKKDNNKICETKKTVTPAAETYSDDLISETDDVEDTLELEAVPTHLVKIEHVEPDEEDEDSLQNNSFSFNTSNSSSDIPSHQIHVKEEIIMDLNSDPPHPTSSEHVFQSKSINNITIKAEDDPLNIPSSPTTSSDEIEVKEEIYVEQKINTDPKNVFYSEQGFQAEMSNIPDYFGESSKSTNATLALVCPHCNQTGFSKCWQLDGHLVYSHTLLIYSNLIPPATSDLVLRSALAQHYREEKKNSKRGFQCGHCATWTKQRFSMFLHLRHLHLERVVAETEVQEQRVGRVERSLQKNPSSCPCCSARFLHVRKLHQHLEEEHSLGMFSKRISKDYKIISKKKRKF